MSNLEAAAKQIAADLGPPFGARSKYRFTVPAEGGARVRTLPAAVFSSPSPSLNSAYVAVAESEADLGRQLTEIGYFGAPYAMLRQDDRFAVYRYVAPLVPKRVASIAPGELSTWVRGELEEGRDRQLTLLAESRELILTETTRALSEVVSGLMSELMTRVQTDHQTAFELVLGAIREAVFGGAQARGRSQAPAAGMDADLLSFAHVPLEAVAELYETLALSADARKRLGVVYTPAWIADGLVGRLPSLSFSGGAAVDPTCGSGTFLVAYLERFVAERAMRTLEPIKGAELRAAVRGLDTDSVAIASTRLTLDLFAHRLGVRPVDWQIEQADATTATVRATTLIGNLPFGYRHGVPQGTHR